MMKGTVFSKCFMNTSSNNSENTRSNGLKWICQQLFCSVFLNI